MQITKITYSKLFSLGNYQNEKIGVEIAIAEGDDVVKCHMEAVNYVEHAHKFQTEYPKYERAKQIMNDPQNYTGHQVSQAQQVAALFEETYKQFLTAAGESTIGVRQIAEPHGDYTEQG